MRDISVGRHDRLRHTSTSREVVYVWSVLITDPETTISGEDQAFSIDRDPLPSSPWTAKTVTSVSGYWKDGESGISDVASNIGINTGGG